MNNRISDLNFIFSTPIWTTILKNQNEINHHIDSIERARDELKDDTRTRELKNWLNYLGK